MTSIPNRKKGKYLLQSAIVLMLVLVAAPDVVIAQTATMADDGSSEPIPVRRERVRNYRRQSSDLQNKINALPSTAVSSVAMPVLFGVGLNNIYPNFGDPRDGGARTHEGEDIMAVKGTPIVSPTAAVVLRTVNGASEGLTVYTANPGGETFVYMHLSAFGEGVASGNVLDPGALIGYVGNTGNASGGAAHLHFEIHNSSGSPVDPFPRLTSEIPLAKKIMYLSAILTKTTDSTALARLLVTNFRGTFTAALADGIALPVQITQALAAIPASVVTPSTNSGLPVGDLDLGSSGSFVVALQNYLILSAKGQAAARLAGAGATGNFGPITKAAMIEFQIATAIAPASGYYGASTRTYITAHPIAGAAVPLPTPSAPAGTASSSSGALLRDLTLGSNGEDVRTLQKVLRIQGIPVIAAGSETTYFGTLTQAAVIRFQILRRITPANGYVGLITRQQLGVL